MKGGFELLPRNSTPDDSRTRLVNAAEQLMREEGYAAVTSRHVASKAGLKPQLVHYHFRSMDDLLLAVVERGAHQLTGHLERVLVSDQPLHGLWEIIADRDIAVLATEFLALANHRRTIRAEVARYGEHFRAVQIELVGRILAARGISKVQFPPAALALIIENVARGIAIEKTLGLSAGHAEVVHLVKRYLDDIEPLQPRTSAPKRKSPRRGVRSG
jgi:AcrR family transcriptional regulator